MLSVLSRNFVKQQNKNLQAQRRKLTNLVLGVPKESLEGEHRVALTPVHVSKLKKAGATIQIEKDAGLGSGFTDELYVKAGATLVDSASAWKSPLICKVRPPTLEEAKKIENRSVMSVIQPRVNTELMNALLAQKATVYSMVHLIYNSDY